MTGYYGLQKQKWKRRRPVLQILKIYIKTGEKLRVGMSEIG
jgi:hypothetical protein